MQISRRREIQDSLNFEGVKTNALFRDDELEKSVGFDGEDTLMQIETNTVMSTAKKNLMEVVRMVKPLS